MATEFNYVARLDTSQIMSGLSEIRSQVGMALGGGMAGLGQTNFGGGVTTGMNQMVSAMGAGGFSRMAQTFTDPAIAYSPHYGMQGAQTTLEQEGLLSRPGGLAAAGRMAPPGVSAGEFAMAMADSNAARRIQADSTASFAVQNTVLSAAGGLLAGTVAEKFGSAGGAMIGRGLFGKAGGAIGGLVGGMGAFMAVEQVVGGAISKHFEAAEQAAGVMGELGTVFGSGRNLSNSQQAEVGIAAYNAAKNIKMDVNQMADIGALARDAGLMPTSSDPRRLTSQVEELGSTIRNIAESLHSSMAQAVQVAKSAAEKGKTVEQAMLDAVGGGNGMGSALYGMGAATARSMGFTGAQGGHLFANALGPSGVTGEESRILGGSMGIASLVGSTQLAAAAGPMGTMQLMAARSGQALGGILDMPGQALAAMGDGDMVSNMIKFQVHGDEYRRGIGAKGIRTMALSQLNGVADMLQEQGDELSRGDAQIAAAMNMYGMSGTQAKAYVGGLTHPGGGGRSRESRLAQLTYNSQSSALGKALDKLDLDAAAEGPPQFSLDLAINGAMIGASANGLTGAAIGGGVGLIAGNYKALGHMAGQVWDGITHWGESSDEAGARSLRNDAEKLDRARGSIREQMGQLADQQDVATRVQKADLSGVSLSLAGGRQADAMTEAAVFMAGIKPTSAGPGTIHIGSSYYATSAVQGAIADYGKPVSKKQRDEYRHLVYGALASEGSTERMYAAMDKAHLVSDEQKVTYGAPGQTFASQRKAVTDGFFDDIGKYAEIIQSAPDSAQAMMAKTELTKSLQVITDSAATPAERAALGKVLQGGSPTQIAAALQSVNVKIGDHPGGQLLRGVASAVVHFRETQEAGMAQSFANVFGRGGDSALSLSAAREVLAGTSGRAMAEAAGKKQWALANKLKTQAIEEYGLNHIGADTPLAADVDIRTSHLSGQGMANVTADVGAQMLQFVGLLGPNSEIARKARVAASVADSFTSFGDQAVVYAENGRVMGKGKFGGRTATPTASRAIGFGEQETAMSTINKSLERTGKMIQALYKQKMDVPLKGTP